MRTVAGSNTLLLLVKLFSSYAMMYLWIRARMVSFLLLVHNTSTKPSRFRLQCTYSFTQSKQSAKLFSSRQNWDSFNPSLSHTLSRLQVCPPLWLRGEGHTCWREGVWESPNSDEGTYIVVLFIYMYFVLLYITIISLFLTFFLVFLYSHGWAYL